MDSFTAQALEMITSPRVREAFDVSREPEPLRARYGEGEAIDSFRRVAWWRRASPW